MLASPPPFPYLPLHGLPFALLIHTPYTRQAPSEGGSLRPSLPSARALSSGPAHFLTSAPLVRGCPDKDMDDSQPFPWCCVRSSTDPPVHSKPYIERISFPVPCRYPPCIQYTLLQCPPSLHQSSFPPSPLITCAYIHPSISKTSDRGRHPPRSAGLSPAQTINA